MGSAVVCPIDGSMAGPFSRPPLPRPLSAAGFLPLPAFHSLVPLLFVKVGEAHVGIMDLSHALTTAEEKSHWIDPAVSFSASHI